MVPPQTCGQFPALFKGQRAKSQATCGPKNGLKPRAARQIEEGVMGLCRADTALRALNSPAVPGVNLKCKARDDLVSLLGTLSPQQRSS